MFQSQINAQPAPGEAGDFYGVNPRASILGGPGMYSAPESGLVVGRFAWVDPSDGSVTQYWRENTQIGFLHRENNAVITEFLGEAVYTVYEGLPVTLFDQGDFWALFAAGATPGQRVWADPGTGAPVAGGATAPQLDSYTAMAGGSGTIAVAANVATVSAAVGYVDAGTIVTSANIAGVALGARLTGTPGGNGTFTLVHADVAAEAFTGANDRLTVSAVTTGPILPGDTVSNPPAAAGTQIVAQLSGTPGDVGLYQIDVVQYFASGAVTSSAVATPWFVNSLADPGELAKISTWG